MLLRFCHCWPWRAFLAVRDLIIVCESSGMALQRARSAACTAWIAEALGSGLSHPLHHSSPAAVICHYASLVQRQEAGGVANAAAATEHPSSQSLVKGSQIVLLQTSAFFRASFVFIVQLEMCCSIQCVSVKIWALTVLLCSWIKPLIPVPMSLARLCHFGSCLLIL